MNKTRMTKEEFRLRPHHIWGLFDIQENPKKYYQSDSEYISDWRQNEEGTKYSELFILYTRDVIRTLHENPEYPFVYINGEDGSDTFCQKCHLYKECYNPKSPMFIQVKEWDTQIVQHIPVLKKMKFGGSYSLNSLKNLIDH